MTATLTVATLTDAIRTVLTRDGDLTGKPAAKDVLAVLGMKGSPEFYAMWGEVKETAVPWQEKAAWVLSTWQGQNRIPGRACRAADAAVAAGATTATAMKAPKGVDAIEHRLRVLRDLLGDKAPATVVGVGDAPKPQTVTPPAPVQQPAAAQSPAPTAAQEPATQQPEPKNDGVLADLQRQHDAAEQSRARELASAGEHKRLAGEARRTAANHDAAAETAMKAAAEHKAAAELLAARIATIVAAIATPAAPVAAEPVQPVIHDAKGSQPSGPAPQNANNAIPAAQKAKSQDLPTSYKDLVAMGADGVNRLGMQLNVSWAENATFTQKAGAVWKAIKAAVPAPSAPQTTKSMPTVPGLFVLDKDGKTYRPATEAAVWAALEAMSKAAA